VRLPEEYRVLSTLDTLKVRTASGLVPLANFITREPVAKLAQINRVDQKRYFDVKADTIKEEVLIYEVLPLDSYDRPNEDGKISLGFGYEVTPEQVEKGEPFNLKISHEPSWFMSFFKGPDFTYHNVPNAAAEISLDQIAQTISDRKAVLKFSPLNANERIAHLTKWLETNPFPAGITWEWTGDQEDQAESQAFLQSAFGGALALMFIILLAQFNSFYNSFLVLLAVVMSTAGVLIGMLVMGQYFSVIMTGVGIVALAGIVVNNNIVLIDTYQEYSRYMPKLEAITRTAEARIRPVLLPTITTMAGLAPMMFGLSLDFTNGGYTIDSPTALWWKNLATAVVFGLGIATMLTLLFTPAMLALRVWATTYILWLADVLARLGSGKSSRAARDWALMRKARKNRTTEVLWPDDPKGPQPAEKTLNAAE
jgi:multidrug efflux pump